MLLFQIGRFQNKIANNDLYAHVPKNSEWQIRLNNVILLKESINGLLKDSSSSEIISSLVPIIEKQTKNKDAKNDLGIDFYNEILIFKTKEGPIGFLFHINNEDLFDKNIRKFNQAQQIGKRDKNKGMILIGKSKESLNHIIENSFKKHNYKYYYTSNLPIQMNAEWKNTAEINKLHFNITEVQNQLLLNGQIQINKNLNYFPFLKENGLHFSSRFVPKEINDGLQNWSNKNKFSFPQINGFSLNYKHLAFIENTPVPEFELLLNFNENISKEQMMQIIQKILPNVILNEANQLTFANQIIHLEKIDHQTMYIGTNPIPELIKSQSIVQLKGDLKALTKIKNGGFAGAFIEMQPKFKAFKTLSEGLNKCNLNINNKGGIAFKMEFKEPKNAYIELIQFALSSQIV